MKWYIDRFLFILIIIVLGILVIPLKYLGGAIVFTGEKIDDLSEYLANLSYADFINKFVDKHVIDTNVRRCKKKNEENQT